MVINTGKSNNDLFITNERAASSKRAENQKSQGSKTVFAGNLNKAPDIIAKKREMAHKQASKLVGDVFKSAKKIEQSMSAMLDKSEELLNQRMEYKAELQNIEGQRGDLMELYGVTEDSQEYADLELLRKEKEANNPLSKVSLTEEEEAKLADIHKAGLTNFQSEMLSLDDAAREYENKAASNEKAAEALNKAWGDMKIELLKSEPMQEARDDAEELLMAANKEIIGELRDEAVDHVEEKLEDVVEEAKKKAEEKEKEEKKTEKRKEKMEKMEKALDKTKNPAGSKTDNSSIPSRHDPVDKVADNLSFYSTYQDKVSKKLTKMMDELDLIMEDLKGVQVDTNI